MYSSLITDKRQGTVKPITLSINNRSRPLWLSWWPTGDQEVAGATPQRSAIIFYRDLSALGPAAFFCGDRS